MQLLGIYTSILDLSRALLGNMLTRHGRDLDERRSSSVGQLTLGEGWVLKFRGSCSVILTGLVESHKQQPHNCAVLICVKAESRI